MTFEMCLQEENFQKGKGSDEYSRWKDWHRNRKGLSLVSGEQWEVQFGFVKGRSKKVDGKSISGLVDRGL